MRHFSLLFLLFCVAVAGAELNLTALPGAFPYSFAALDSAGNIYIAGNTNGAIPLVNPIQASLSSGNCSSAISSPACNTAFVAKLDPTRTKVLYSTYLGPDRRYATSGLAVDAAGNAYVSGTASAPNASSTPSIPQAFLFKVNAAGSALVYSLYIDASTGGSAVAVDSAGDAYLAGASSDLNFPTLNSTLTVPPLKNTFATNDGGATWRAINIGIPALAINSLAIDPAHTGTLYAAATTGLYKSLDAGATWSQLLPAAAAASQILLDPKNPSTLYVLYTAAGQFATQFAKSTDAGATWQSLTSALPPPWVPGTPLMIGTIALDPENSQAVWMTIAIPGAPSVFMSGDGGAHWQDVHDFPAFFVGTGSTGAGILIDPANSSRVYVCCTYRLGQTATGVFRTDDGGKTWITGGVGIGGVPVLDPHNASTLCAPGGTGLVLSTDAGETWTALPGSTLASSFVGGTHTLAIDATGALYQVQDFGTLLRSADGGVTWTVHSGPWVSSSSILALDPVNPSSTIYIGSVSPSVEHAFVAKLDPGGAYLWATLLGGSQQDSAQAIAVDPAGNVYLAGVTDSPDFPTVNAFQKGIAVNPARPTFDAFVARLTADGSRLVYSSFLGGIYNETVTGIAADSAGNAYVAGYTESTDFPTLNPIQPTAGFGLSTGFLSKIGSGGALVYSTYLGGSDRWAGSAVAAIALTAQGGVWVAGTTSSVALPLVQAIQPSNTGGRFLAEIDPSGASWDFSTYLDTNILAMAPLAGGSPWLAATGYTGSLNLGPPPPPPAGVPLILSAYNAASFDLSDKVAPGEAVTIFGEELAPAAQAAPAYPLPLTLQGVSVTVGGIAAPLYYVSPGQINFQVPFGVPLGGAALVVTRGSQSGQRALTVAAVAPGIFTATGDGSSGAAYVVHASDYSRVTQSNPAVAGEYLAIFCTGLGATTPPSIEGQPASAGTIQATYYFVDINSREAMPSYAGPAPGYAGLYQVNFQLPGDQQSGVTVVSFYMGSGNSQILPLWVQ